MTAVDLTPNATVVNQGATVVNAATVHECLAAFDDSSYIIFDADSDYVVVDLSTVTVPAGAVVKSIQVMTYVGPHETPPDDGETGSVYVLPLDQNLGWDYSSASYWHTNQNGQWWAPPTVRSGGVYSSILTQTQINQLRIQLDAGVDQLGDFGSRVYGAKIELRYALAPTVVATAPVGGQTDNTPDVIWGYTAGSDGGPQTKYQVKIFTDAQYTAGGFNPETSAAAYSSGTIASEIASHTVGSNLANNDTYRAYVKAAQTINGTDQWSSWTFSEFVLNVKPTVGSFSPLGQKTYTTSQTIDWVFSHLLGGMSQTAYRVIIKRALDNSTYLDTNKTTSTNTQHTVSSWETLTTSRTYYYTVQVWDTADVASDVSPAQYVTLTVVPTVVLTNPSPSEILSDQFTINWYIDIGDGSPSQTDQSQYRVLIYQGATTLVDTGWVTSEAGSWYPSDYTIFVDQGQYEVEVRLKDDLGVEGTSGRVAFGVAWTPPNPPSGVVTVNLERYYWNLISGSGFTTPDHSSLDIQSDITLMAEIAVAGDVWTGRSVQFLGKWVGSSLSYRVYLTTNGNLAFQYTTNGTTIVERTSTATLVGKTEWLWVAATFDANVDGTSHEVRFWTSLDAVNWTQLGATITTGGVVTMHSGSSALWVGDTVQGWGMVRNARVYNGIGAGGIPGGTLVANWQAVASYPYTDTTGKVWTMVGTPTRFLESPDTTGAAIVQWNGSARDGSFVEWRIYRRLHGMTTWEYVGSSISPSAVATFEDFFFDSNLSQDWRVAQVVNRNGSLIESSQTLGVASDVTPESDKYWIFDYTDPAAYKVRLENVVSDSFDEEYETFESRVIGRGRRVEIGDNDGVRGSLTEHERTAIGASATRAALDAIKLQRNQSILRTPFGDTFKVVLGNIGYSRVSGVGTRELLDITIPYIEVI